MSELISVVLTCIALATCSEVLPPESAQHPLKYSYTFHVVRRKPKGKTASANTSWAENIEEIGSFGTVRKSLFYHHPLVSIAYHGNESSKWGFCNRHFSQPDFGLPTEDFVLITGYFWGNDYFLPLCFWYYGRWRRFGPSTTTWFVQASFRTMITICSEKVCPIRCVWEWSMIERVFQCKWWN